MFALMTNKEIYRHYLVQLQPIYSANEAMVITDWVFEKVAGVHRSELIKNPEHRLPSEITVQLDSCLTDLVRHKPVQYVVGEAWFYKMKLIVNEQVLIPRPETEELVQLVIDYCEKEKIMPSKSGDRISILDIGTGSGCIAIAVKKNLPTTMVHAIDVSKGALLVAKENALLQKAEIDFIEIDFLDESNWNQLPKLDIIISNPPYIPLNEKEKLDKNVTQFEPHQALFVKDSAPFIFYAKIAIFGKTHLLNNGTIFVEIHEEYAKETAAIFETDYLIETKKDIFGKQRMLIITKKNDS
jgi:release factor glutamine methyltransferase